MSLSAVFDLGNLHKCPGRGDASETVTALDAGQTYEMQMGEAHPLSHPHHTRSPSSSSSSASVLVGLSQWKTSSAAQIPPTTSGGSSVMSDVKDATPLHTTSPGDSRRLTPEVGQGPLVSSTMSGGYAGRKAAASSSWASWFYSVHTGSDPNYIVQSIN